MFRLAEYETTDPELYTYLSAIASETIYQALDDLFRTAVDAGDFYENTLAGPPNGPLHTDFFKDLANYIPERSSVETSQFDGPISEDGRAGIELIDRKTRRMMEKMRDNEKYYTFDLFEELLFNIVIETSEMLEEMMEDQERQKLTKKIQRTADELRSRFELEEDEIPYLAEVVHRIDKMGLDDGELFFWDDDFNIVFKDGFVAGIRYLISGGGGFLGYGYSDVCSIFTDAGIKAPLLLVGSETAYEIRGDVVKERVAKIKSPFDEGYDSDMFDDADLPFG